LLLPLLAGEGAQVQGEAALALLLPLLAGGGWEVVKLLIFEAKSDPTPTLPCEQGREQSSGVREMLLCSCPCLQGEVGRG